ncbi:hypothetical protein ACLOJK_000244 [Asimina triloba]
MLRWIGRGIVQAAIRRRPTEHGTADAGSIMVVELWPWKREDGLLVVAICRYWLGRRAVEHGVAAGWYDGWSSAEEFLVRPIWPFDAAVMSWGVYRINVADFLDSTVVCCSNMLRTPNAIRLVHAAGCWVTFWGRSAIGEEDGGHLQTQVDATLLQLVV